MRRKSKCALYKHVRSFCVRRWAVFVRHQIGHNRYYEAVVSLNTGYTCVYLFLDSVGFESFQMDIKHRCGDAESSQVCSFEYDALVDQSSSNWFLILLLLGL